MNEGNGAEAFEVYLRQGISNLAKRPMMIMLDTKKSRVDLLKAYYKNGVLITDMDMLPMNSNYYTKNILEFAKKSKIDLIDTAIDYGDSEKVIGKSSIYNFSCTC